MASWWNKSGGFGYHYLAWRQGRRWQNYRALLEQFLQISAPAKGQLLLIGASGGYTLPNSWLKGFEKIEVVDPDPLARHFFLRTHSNLKPNWSMENYLVDSARQWQGTGLHRLLADYPDHLVLFSNLIGQLPLLIQQPDLSDTPQWESWQQDWHRALSDRPWVSIHDLFSSSIEPNRPLPPVDHSCSKQELIAQLYSGNKKVSLVDHLTYGLLPTPDSAERFVWPLHSSQIHLVEACAKNC